MLDTPPFLIPNPALANKHVQQLMTHFAGALPWLSHCYGLVQTGQRKVGTKVETYPQIYLQDGGRETDDLRPDERMKALCFFERNGSSEIDWADDMHQGGHISHPLAAVVWLNLKLIDRRPYDFSDELAMDFLTTGLLDSPLGAELTPDRLEQQIERVFSRYSFAPSDKQLLMYPFAGFRLPFTVREEYYACPTPFVAQNPPVQ